MIYRNLPIRMKYIVMLFAFVFVPFFVAGLILLHIWNGQDQENMHRTQLFQLNLVNQELEEKLSGAEDASVSLGSDRQFQEILKSRHSEGKYYPILLRRKIETILNRTDLAQNIQIWKDGELFWQSGSVTLIPQNKKETNPAGYWSGLQVMYSFDHGGFTKENEIISYQNTISYGSSVAQSAEICVNIREEDFEALYSGLLDPSNIQICLTNRMGESVSYSEEITPGNMDIVWKTLEKEETGSGHRVLQMQGKPCHLYWIHNQNTGGYLWMLQETGGIRRWSPWVYTGLLLLILSSSFLPKNKAFSQIDISV